MHAALRNVPDYLIRDLPPFAAAMGIAEVFYKFGSFTLECLAFLASWYALARLYRLALASAGYRPRGRPDMSRP